MNVNMLVVAAHVRHWSSPSRHLPVSALRGREPRAPRSVRSPTEHQGGRAWLRCPSHGSRAPSCHPGFAASRPRTAERARSGLRHRRARSSRLRRHAQRPRDDRTAALQPARTGAVGPAATARLDRGSVCRVLPTLYLAEAAIFVALASLASSVPWLPHPRAGRDRRHHRPGRTRPDARRVAATLKPDGQLEAGTHCSTSSSRCASDGPALSGLVVAASRQRRAWVSPPSSPP